MGIPLLRSWRAGSGYVSAGDGGVRAGEGHSWARSHLKRWTSGPRRTAIWARNRLERDVRRWVRHNPRTGAGIATALPVLGERKDLRESGATKREGRGATGGDRLRHSTQDRRRHQRGQ